MKRILTDFSPMAIIGLLMYKMVKNIFMGSETIILWSLFIGGLFLIVFELFYREKDNAVCEIEKISYKQSFVVGLFQYISIIPGVSRSAATIIGGLCLGIKRKTIVEFSFLLVVPTMLAATGLDVVKNAHSFSSSQFTFLALGFLTSLIVALISIKFLLFFIKHNNFIFFGIYRIILALSFWFFS